MRSMYPISRRLRLRGGGKDGFGIVPKGIEPTGEIGCVIRARRVGKAEIRHQIAGAGCGGDKTGHRNAGAVLSEAE